MSRRAWGLVLSKMTALKGSEGSGILPRVIAPAAPQRAQTDGPRSRRASTGPASSRGGRPERPPSLFLTCTPAQRQVSPGAANTPTSITPGNSAFLHPPAAEQPPPERSSFLLESCADSSAARGFGDLSRWRQGCEGTPSPRPPGSQLTAQPPRSDLLHDFSSNGRAFREQRRLHSQVKRGQVFQARITVHLFVLTVSCIHVLKGKDFCFMLQLFLF